MSEIFISYARGEARTAEAVAGALRALGYDVWRDDALPPHRGYAEVIEERIDAAKAVLVLWSADAAKSQWVRSEADRGRAQGKLVQAALGPVRLPMPFDQIQCEDLSDWAGGALVTPVWRKLVASLAEVSGRPAAAEGAAPPRAAAVARPAQLPAIAVLPFTSAGGEEERQLADGMVDEIVAALSRFPQLKVIASHAGRDDPRGSAEVARELGARYFLEGAVRRAGARVRVSVSLTAASDQAQIWAERIDGAADDAFELQDRVALVAAAQIAPSIDAAETHRTLSRPIDELSAHELFLRAAHLQRAFTLEGMQEALAALDLAVARDPNFGGALAFASLLHSLILLNGWADDPAATAGAARDLARRALNTGALDSVALATIATVFIWVGEDIGASEAMVQRALAQNPGAATPWFGSAWVKLFGGQAALAIEHFERHMALDPRSPLQPFVAGGIGCALTVLGRFDEAVLKLREALRAVPDQRPFRVCLTAALAQLGHRDEAATILGGLPPSVPAYVLGLFRNEADSAAVRQGLQLAGADI
jgi:adenylate cyclase